MANGGMRSAKHLCDKIRDILECTNGVQTSAKTAQSFKCIIYKLSLDIGLDDKADKLMMSGIMEALYKL